MNQHRRLGRFRITDIDACMREAKIVLARVVVVRAELMYMDSAIEYVAISDDFDTVDIGELVPMYTASLRYDGMGGCTFDKWTRI